MWSTGGAARTSSSAWAEATTCTAGAELTHSPGGGGGTPPTANEERTSSADSEARTSSTAVGGVTTTPAARGTTCAGTLLQDPGPGRASRAESADQSLPGLVKCGQPGLGDTSGSGDRLIPQP